MLWLTKIIRVHDLISVHTFQLTWETMIHHLISKYLLCDRHWWARHLLYWGIQCKRVRFKVIQKYKRTFFWNVQQLFKSFLIRLSIVEIIDNSIILQSFLIPKKLHICYFTRVINCVEDAPKLLEDKYVIEQMLALWANLWHGMWNKKELG